LPHCTFPVIREQKTFINIRSNIQYISQSDIDFVIQYSYDYQIHVQYENCLVPSLGIRPAEEGNAQVAEVYYFKKDFLI
jgi:hypothetical protein